MWSATPQWVPWTQSNALELLQSAHEKTVLDLKERYNLEEDKTKFEIAKDLVAFANSFGGTILVGVSEKLDNAERKTGRPKAFPSIEDAAALISQISVCARDFCRPPIVVDPQEIVLTAEETTSVLGRQMQNGARLLAVNVSPLITGPAGVFALGKDGKKQADAFRFPVRVGEVTKLLMPEELAFYMNSHERRMLLQLQQIRPDDTVRVWHRRLNGNLEQAREFNLRKIDAERQIATIELRSSTEKMAHVPLAFVKAVWLDEKGGWQVAVDGSVCDFDSAGVGFIPPGGYP